MWSVPHPAHQLIILCRLDVTHQPMQSLVTLRIPTCYPLREELDCLEEVKSRSSRGIQQCHQDHCRIATEYTGIVSFITSALTIRVPKLARLRLLFWCGFLDEEAGPDLSHRTFKVWVKV